MHSNKDTHKHIIRNATCNLSPKLGVIYSVEEYFDIISKMQDELTRLDAVCYVGSTGVDIAFKYEEDMLMFKLKFGEYL